MPLFKEELRSFIRSMLDEDIGRGDITTLATIPADATLLLTKKVEAIYQEEAQFFDAKVSEIAGSQKEELQVYIEAQEMKAVELQAKFEIQTISKIRRHQARNLKKTKVKFRCQKFK